MLNNINNTNSPAFGAKLKISTTVKDSARLANITKAFEERTPQFKETLSLTSLGREWDNHEYLHIGTNHEIDTGAFFKTSLDTMMDNLSDNEIVTKLVKGLKALKEVKKREFTTMGSEDKKHIAEHEQKRNNLIAASCREKGQDVMASRFEYLAKCFGKKILKIDKEIYESNCKFLDKLDKIADGDEDILYFREVL